MALIFPSSYSLNFISSNSKHSYHIHQFKSIIKSQNNSSQSQSPSPSSQSTNATSSSPSPLGFGSSSSSSKSKSKKSVVRRAPVEPPKPQKGNNEDLNQQGSTERAFLLTWLGLGSLIIIEGIALAASGFLPEEWDKLFVKYLYPSFTPTVFLFVAGTVVYGVSKYLENEKPNSSN